MSTYRTHVVFVFVSLSYAYVGRGATQQLQLLCVDYTICFSRLSLSFYQFLVLSFGVLFWWDSGIADMICKVWSVERKTDSQWNDGFNSTGCNRFSYPPTPQNPPRESYLGQPHLFRYLLFFIRLVFEQPHYGRPVFLDQQSFNSLRLPWV